MLGRIMLLAGVLMVSLVSVDDFLGAPGAPGWVAGHARADCVAKGAGVTGGGCLLCVEYYPQTDIPKPCVTIKP